LVSGGLTLCESGYKALLDRVFCRARIRKAGHTLEVSAPMISCSASDCFRILVVDDERLICELVESLFQGPGMEVEVASSGAEALERASRNPPDLILLDVVLPGLSGLSICQLLRMRPRLRDVPIYMLTARARAGDHADSARAGATGHIEKPFRGDELAEIVARHRRPDVTPQG
jgi:CheY-like chemotaxis protein